MKTFPVLTMFGLLSICSTVFGASTEHELLSATGILDAASHCAGDLDKLSKIGRVGKAALLMGSDTSGYVINFVTGGLTPPFQSTPVAKLIILTESSGGELEYRCSVVPAQKP